MGHKRRHGDTADGRAQPTSMASLRAELDAAWARQQATLPPPEEVRALPARDTTGFSQYIGRPVLSKTLNYITGKWQTAAADRDLAFNRVRPPIGLRYLGFTTLKMVKHCSRHGVTESGEPIPNPNFRPVRALGQIVDQAYADTANFDAVKAADNFEGYGTRLAIRRYPQEDESLVRLALGVEVSDTASTIWTPTLQLAAERRYFLTRYDPLHDPNRDGAPNSSVFVPLGWVEGVQDRSDARFQDLVIMCQQLLPIKTVLGPVQLVEEAPV
jgi:hypothetical protein